MADESFRTMQEEALSCVREMQRRSQNYAPPPTPPPPEPAPDKSEQSNSDSKTLFSLGGIKIDEEKALIALLIYILYKNNADMKLLLGLGYLLI